MQLPHSVNSLSARAALALLCIGLFGLALPYVAGPELLHYRPWMILFLLNALFLFQFITLALDWERLKLSHESLQVELSDASLYIVVLRAQLEGAGQHAVNGAVAQRSESPDHVSL
jgi:hypothetical protein